MSRATISDVRCWETGGVISISQQLDDLYRSESRRIFATLIRLLGDFDLAEDALQEAFQAALEQWPVDGVPANPVAWLISTGRFKGIDRRRRQARFGTPLDAVPEPHETDAQVSGDETTSGLDDDRLRLIFTCCHPALPADARAALTLREVCGLTTEEIARAFLVLPTAIAQRIVRAKSKIKDARIPYELPSKKELPDRLDTVLQVIYLVFNEGYSASSGDQLTRPDISGEGIRLGRLLRDLLPAPEVTALLGLMLLQESRRAARASADGNVILLENQDRRLWNAEQISEGTALVDIVLSGGVVGRYALQAAIAAVHANSPAADQTDWGKIISLYDLLLKLDPSPVIELNRAVALAMRDGPMVGLEIVDSLLARGELDQYQWVHSVRADLCRRLGKREDARESYRTALSLAQQAPERRFLQQRLDELS